MGYLRKHRPLLRAFDTETYQGQAYLLTCSSGRYLFDDCKPLSTAAMLDFIFAELDRGYRLGFFFNINFDTGAILKQALLQANRQQIKGLKKHHRFEAGLRIKVIPNRALDIRDRKGRNAHLYDVSRMIQDGSGTMSLQECASRFLGESKLKDVDSSKLNVSLPYWRKHLKEIISYGVRDAKLTERLAVFAIDKIHEAFNFYPRFYHSKASISKAWLEWNYPELRKLFMEDDKHGAWLSKLGLTKEAMQLIYKSYYGGVFDTWVFGSITDVDEIDINSAYPLAISQLPSLSRLRLKTGSEYHADAVIGAYKVLAPYQCGRFPMPYRTKGAVLYIDDAGDEIENPYKPILYPDSDARHVQYWPKITLDYMSEHHYPFRVVDAVEMFGERRPQFQRINAVYEKRLLAKSKSDTDRGQAMLQFALKIVMNACYGGFAQIRPHPTTFTNFLYAATITASCRLQLYDLLERIGSDNAVMLATDAVTFHNQGQDLDGYFSVYDGQIPILNQVNLGSCKKEVTNADALILQNGFYQLTKPGLECTCPGPCDKHVKKTRGIPAKYVDFNAFAKLRGSKKHFMRDKPVRLFQQLHSKGNIRRVGVWEPYKFDLDLTENYRKRQFGREPTFPAFLAGSVRMMPWGTDDVRPQVFADMPLPRSAQGLALEDD
jgi:hypothetical protein